MYIGINCIEENTRGVNSVYTTSNPYTTRFIDNPEPNQKAINATYQGIRREASTLHLYNQLAEKAPSDHKNEIGFACERSKAHLKYFTDLYIHLTGRMPNYKIDEVAFQNYEEGLEIAHQIGAQGQKEYRDTCSFVHNPHVQNIFWWASMGEHENMMRFKILTEKTKRKVLKDYGGKPFVINIEEATTRNNTYRTALWTGKHLQVTLMSINVGDDIGLEVHPHTDQFLRIEEGHGLVQMGDSKENLTFNEKASKDDAIMVPAGMWHNVTNIGHKPLKVYAIYAPPEHPRNTVEKTKPVE